VNGRAARADTGGGTPLHPEEARRRPETQKACGGTPLRKIMPAPPEMQVDRKPNLRNAQWPPSTKAMRRPKN